MSLPPPLPLPLPSPLPLSHWVISNEGKDRVRVVIDSTLTRTEMFRLIGELERAGGNA